MRAMMAGCALSLLGSAVAHAQPYGGDAFPPPPPYDDGFDGPPSPHHRHCRIVEGVHGPHRICPPEFR